MSERTYLVKRVKPMMVSVLVEAPSKPSAIMQAVAMFRDDAYDPDAYEADAQDERIRADD